MIDVQKALDHFKTTVGKEYQAQNIEHQQALRALLLERREEKAKQKPDYPVLNEITSVLLDRHLGTYVQPMSESEFLGAFNARLKAYLGERSSDNVKQLADSFSMLLLTSGDAWSAEHSQAMRRMCQVLDSHPSEDNVDIEASKSCRALHA